MLRVERRIPSGSHSDVLALPYDDRKKSRLLARTERGQEVAIVLERGSMLRDGELLAADSGEILQVRAAAESVSDVPSDDAQLLARAAYHLGNRHVPLQIEPGLLRYQHDHVLDAMLRELGLEVTVHAAAFQPEGGAYARGHSHEHDHDHMPLPVPIGDYDEHAHVHDHAAHDHVNHDDHDHEHTGRKR